MGLTRAQRYNKMMDDIFSQARKLQREQDSKAKFIGRNIGEKDGLYFLTWSERDTSSVYDKDQSRWYFESYKLASEKMSRLIRNGAHWFDAHFDPTI